MMNKKCLYCYKQIENSVEGDFHEHCSMSFFGTKKAPAFPYSFNQMSELAKDIVERRIALPGVQPKLSLSLIKKIVQNDDRSRLTVVGAMGGNYIFKPPSMNYPEMPQNEHLTMRIAEAFGINTVKSSLIKLASGELSYITKRLDRTETGEKIHMLDMFQILEAFDKYKSSMEKVGKALDEYSKNTLLDALRFFELSIFCFLTGNNDMHLKNFSMIIGEDNTWALSPSYDLLNAAIINPDDTEEMALTMGGKKRKLKLEHFKEFGKGLGLNDKQLNTTFNRFAKNKPKALLWIERSFLSDKYKKKYMALLEKRYEILK